MSSYLSSVKKQFAQYKKLGEKAMEQVPDDRLAWQYNDDSNSIATVVKHMAGNMLSRWTDFLTSDGEKEWRHRDTEFENDINDRKSMMEKWETGWKCLFDAIDPLTENDLEKTIHIRQEPMTVTDAINRQLAHYAYHVGQIVYLAKMLCSDHWNSLTIPKGKSEEFNASMNKK